MTEHLPPIGWFRDPGLPELTPLTVDDDGRVYGHLAGWQQAHTSFPGRRITPPRSASDYRWFHTGAYTVRDGDERCQVSVGALTMNTGHASTSLNADAAAAHYDNTGSVVAVVCAGEDAHGIWYSGSMLPDVDELTRRRFGACGLSGDWRAIESGRLDLVAALAVPHGGFPIPRARVASGAPLALVAAGALPPSVQAFAKLVDPAWQRGVETGISNLSASNVTVGKLAAGNITQRVVGLNRAVTPADLADLIAARLHDRRQDDELAAQRDALIGELDDTPAEFARLIGEVDDTPHRASALLAELDDDAFEVSHMPEQLKQVWLHGEIAARIAYGTPGQFDRCRAIAREKGIPGHQIDGLCSNLIFEATGERPGPRKKG